MNLKQEQLNVVGIGASAGGLKALQELFNHIPNNTGMAFVIVQHLSPDFKSLMPELLSKHTDMRIYTAKDKQMLKPNCIYLNQRNKNLHLKGSKIYQLEKGPRNNLNLPIDIFFHTLGEEFKERAYAVILSGTGSDGSRGIRSIKENGGTIIVQDPKKAQFDGMPNSAIHTNTVDYVLDIQRIAETLTNKRSSVKLLEVGNNEADKIETQIKKILVDVFKYSGIDFREYKKNTLFRRLEKRMNINNFTNLPDYARFLQDNDDEKNALKNDFLIGVTRFFRDEEAFNSLKEDVIPNICLSKKSGETARIWIPGCSTGEEVYSIAILFSNFITKNKLNIDFKIFATDIDNRGLNKASAGLYSMNIINEIEKEYLDKYFFKLDEELHIIKKIRERIVFSRHNLINDPPFINMDLISCRNLLIYLDFNIQKRVMQNFQFALNIFGYLFLGNSESLGVVAKHFKTINTKWKIFQNITESKYSPSHTQIFTKFKDYNTPVTKQKAISIKDTTAVNEFQYDKYLSKRHSPDAIFVDTEFNILFIRGSVGKKLHHGDGIFQNNLLKILNDDIAILLKNGLRRLEKLKTDIEIKNVVQSTDKGSFTFDITLHKPIRDKNLKHYYLIEFTEDKKIDSELASVNVNNLLLDRNSKEQIEDLEYELKIVKSELQNAIEELETTNEELQSSNEELMAANEELQSTNEELQSVNEELYTVNTEMQEKNKELTILSNDLSNLLDNTAIATIFLDNNLCIRKFTPAIKSIFNLQEEDIGRKLATFTSNFDAKTSQDLIQDAQLSLDNIKSIENQLTDKDGNYYLQRVSPFITSNKIIDGVIITINNINKIKEVERELKEVDYKYHNLFQNLHEGFVHGKIILNAEGKAVDWEYLDVNPAYEKSIGISAKDLIGNRISQFLPELIHEPNKWIEKYAETALHGKKQTIEGYVNTINKYFHVNTFSPKKGEFAGTISDFTELKAKEKELIDNKYELDVIQRITQVGSWKFDIATGKVDWTEELYRIYKLDPTTPVPNYESHAKLYTPQSWKLLSKAVTKTLENGTPYELELEMVKANGEHGWLRAKGEAVKEHGKIISLRGSAQDITKVKQNELDLIKSEYELKNVQRLTKVGSWVIDVETGNLQWTEELYKMFKLNPAKRAPNMKNHAKLFTPESWSKLSKAVNKAQATGASYKVELEFIKTNGEHGWCLAHGETVKIDNKVIKVRGSAQDITSIKENERALIYAKKQAEEAALANLQKNYFLANMSHEIRTPISSVLGFADLLRNDSLKKEDRLQYLEIIDNNSKQLLNLINDIIDISKIDSGKLKIHFDSCDIDYLLDNLTLSFEQIKLQKDKTNLKLKAVIPKDLKGLQLITDPIRLEQILTNLINNAIKFSKKGTITYGYKKQDNYIKFYVEDQGIGIAKEKQLEIFDSFKQLNYKNNENCGGTGLGLAICKALVTLLGGQITVQSQPSKGSRFEFTLPLKVKTNTTLKPAAKNYNGEQFLKNKSILIAEDNNLIRLLLETVLKKTGATLKFANNGKSAVDYFKKQPNVDLVLLDIRMPKMSGIEALEHILKINPNTKIIMQTAHAMEEEKTLCFNKGCVDFISKPIIKEHLYQTLDKWLN